MTNVLLTVFANYKLKKGKSIDTEDETDDFRDALLHYFTEYSFPRMEKELNNNKKLSNKDVYIYRDYYQLYDVLCVLEIIYNERKKNKKGGKRKSRRKSRNNRRKTNVRRRSRT